MTGRWFRDVYRDAVWESPALKAAEKAVAETYARHARDKEGNKSANADLAWLTYERLMEKAGVGRRASVSTAVTRLVDLGWLKPVQQVSRRATVYRLTIPMGGSSDGGTTDADEPAEPRSSDGGTTVVPFSGSGSSTFPSDSSDGGTQPLGPSKELTITSTSPYPSVATSPPDVVEAEIVEGEADVTSSLEDQLQTLTDEIRRTRPNWSAAELRTYITAAMSMLGESFEAAAEVARRTAKDPNSAKPSRITASGNPHLKDASTAFLLAKVDSVDVSAAFGQPHPKAHPFQPDSSGISCQQCGTPVQNGMHKVGNQGGGYVTQRRSPAAAQLDAEFERNGGGFRPGSNYHRLVDSHSPHRDYSGPL